MKIYLAGKMNCEGKKKFREKYLWWAEILTSDGLDSVEPKNWNHTPPKELGLGWNSVDNEADWAPVNEHVIQPIQESDVVVAYISESTAYGTIAEIGFAAGTGKPVFVYAPELMHGEADRDITYDDECCEIRCDATDAYWLVLCFPKVQFERIDIESANPRIVRLEIQDWLIRKKYKDPRSFLFD